MGLDAVLGMCRKVNHHLVERTVTWFETPEDADQADILHYSRMTSQEKLDEMVRLLNEFGKWNEQRLNRIVRFVEVPPR